MCDVSKGVGGRGGGGETPDFEFVVVAIYFISSAI